MAETLICRTFEFDAGHRVWGHESKCAHLHGHRYKAEVYLVAPGLDNLGRVLDFGVVKSLVGTWIDDNWDHNMILHPEDALAELIDPPPEIDVDRTKLFGQERVIGETVQGFKEPFIMPFRMNPTAENLARVLFFKVTELLDNTPYRKDLKVYGVKIWETPNCFAMFPAFTALCGPNGIQEGTEPV